MGIPIEICPTSNMQATRCTSVDHLPHLQEFLKHDSSSLSICCDDTLLFKTDITKELFLFAKAAGLERREDIEVVVRRSREAAFLTEKD